MTSADFAKSVAEAMQIFESVKSLPQGLPQGEDRDQLEVQSMADISVR